MPRRIPGTCAVALVAVLTCTSCIRNFYVLELQPTRDGLQRRLTVEGRITPDSVARSIQPSLEKAESSRLGRAYGTHAIREAGRPYVFQRVFRLDLPDDIGCKGSCRRTTSLLGETRIYFERFRGDPDPAGTLVAQLGAMDSLCDLLIGWTGAELGREPRYPALRSFLDGRLRSGLRNFVLDLWLDASGTGEPYPDLADARIEGLAGIGWLRTMLDPLEADSAAASRKRTLALRGVLAAGMGIGDERGAARALPFLANPDSARRSLARYLARYDAEGGAPREADAIFAEYVRRGIGPALEGLGGTEDSLTIRLALPVPPVESNGSWDPAAGVVRWCGTLATPTRRDTRLPMLCHAKWSVPDSVRQRLLFGRVLLRGEKLADYCSWFGRLAPQKAREWDRMLVTLKPGDLLPLVRFRFADERAKPGAPTDSTASSLADPARDLIVSAAEQQR